MFLVRLLYCSTPSGIGDVAIEAILDKSRANNQLDNITGVLIYNGSYFLQCLEGSRSNVSRRFIAIANDSRHKDIEIIDLSPISERRFPQWTMQYVGKTDLDQSIVSSYTTGEFDPRRMIFPEGIVDMLWRLAQ
ncbi:MAG: BLUF domain-containing protein [Rhodospirillaceae bacterium]